MTDIKYSQVNKYLLDVLPTIRQHFENAISALYAHDNPHVVYGSILVEYINSLANELGGPNHIVSDRVLRDCFRLIEELSASSDFETRCLVETSVVEGLFSEKDGLQRFAPYMGVETKKLARTVAESWGLNVEVLS